MSQSLFMETTRIVRMEHITREIVWPTGVSAVAGGEWSGLDAAPEDWCLWGQDCAPDVEVGNWDSQPAEEEDFTIGSEWLDRGQMTLFESVVIHPLSDSCSRSDQYAGQDLLPGR